MILKEQLRSQVLDLAAAMLMHLKMIRPRLKRICLARSPLARQPPQLKPNRRAKRTFNQIEKKKEKDKTRAPAVELPEWAPFSNIEHLADTPVAKTAMKGFQREVYV